MIFAGFTGSVDRIVKLCLKEKWDVVRCDQGNFQVFAAKSDSPDGVLATAKSRWTTGPIWKGTARSPSWPTPSRAA